MPVEIQITRDLIISDLLFLLHSLQLAENDGQLISVREARETLDAAVTLNFNDYARFLRQTGHIEVTKQETLALTGSGRALLTSVPASFGQQTATYFANQLGQSTFGFEYIPPSPGEKFDVASILRREPEQQSEPSAIPAASDFVRGEVVGRGPVGRVLRARHSLLSTQVALKELTTHANVGRKEDARRWLERLQREVGAQARLKHPAVVTVHDLDLGNEPVIVGEFCEGGNLRQRVLSPTPPTVDETLRCFMQLLDGLATAEAQGLTHGNIKPENVLFDRYGNAKLTDFGIARLSTDPTGDERQRDISKLGALLYVALTKQAPGPAAPFASRIVPGLPSAIDWVIDRMTTGAANERYKTIAETQEALYQALADPDLGQPGRPVVLTAVTEDDLTGPS